MKKVMLNQGSQEWLDWRKQGIGASEIAAIMGVCPYKSAADIYDDKKGLSTPFVNAAMQRGKDYEEEAREEFEFFHENHIEGLEDKLKPICVESEENPIFRASLDGWNEKRSCLVELKVPNKKVFYMAGCRGIPTHYLYQVQWQMGVTGTPKAYYACYDPDSKELHVVEVYRDSDLINEMEKAALSFWDDLINDRRPASKKDTYFLFDDKEQARLDNLAMLKEQIKKLEAQYKEEQQALIKDLGDESSLENEDFILYRGERSSVDYKKACEDAKISLEAYQKPKTISWTIKRKK